MNTWALFSVTDFRSVTYKLKLFDNLYYCYKTEKIKPHRRQNTRSIF
jgi:hypothetical protein